MAAPAPRKASAATPPAMVSVRAAPRELAPLSRLDNPSASVRRVRRTSPAEAAAKRAIARVAPTRAATSVLRKPAPSTVTTSTSSNRSAPARAERASTRTCRLPPAARRSANNPVAAWAAARTTPSAPQATTARARVSPANRASPWVKPAHEAASVKRASRAWTATAATRVARVNVKPATWLAKKARAHPPLPARSPSELAPIARAAALAKAPATARSALRAAFPALRRSAAPPLATAPKRPPPASATDPARVLKRQRSSARRARARTARATVIAHSARGRSTALPDAASRS